MPVSRPVITVMAMDGWLNTRQPNRDASTVDLYAAPQAVRIERRLVGQWARTSDEVQLAQRLRYQVFVEEMGATLQTPEGTPEGLDADPLDDFCEHLLVWAQGPEGSEVVGTYRVMTPDSAQRACGLYTAQEFEIEALSGITHELLEVGRSCVHKDWRTGGVILKLWAGVAQFLVANELRYMMGCASMTMNDGGHEAACLWSHLRMNHLGDAALRVTPRLPLPIQEASLAGPVDPPALIKGYLSLGAKVLGPPAWDPAFGTADFPMLLDMQTMSPAFRHRLLRSA